MNDIHKLAEKRKKQFELARRIGNNLSDMATMSDCEIRFENISQKNSPLDIILKENISFIDVYSFACEYSQRNNFKNILDEKIDDSHSLFHNSNTLSHLIKTRSMNEAQYVCCMDVVDMMLSGNYADYNAVDNLKYK